MTVAKLITIKVNAAALLDGPNLVDDIELDKRLGELAMLVQEAREEIDADWRERRQAQRGPLLTTQPPEPALDDLA